MVLACTPEGAFGRVKSVGARAGEVPSVQTGGAVRKEIAVAEPAWRLSRHLEDAAAADDVAKHGSIMARKPDCPVVPCPEVLLQQTAQAKQGDGLAYGVHADDLT